MDKGGKIVRAKRVDEEARKSRKWREREGKEVKKGEEV